MVGDIIISGVCLGLLFGLVAIGYSLIWSTMTLLHFAHGEFVTLGAFMALTYIAVTGLVAWPITIMIMVALTVAVFGGIVERITYRQIPIYAFTTRIICTVGVGEVLRSAVALIWGSRTHPLPEGFFHGSPIQVSGLFISPAYYWIFGVSLVLVLGLIYLLYGTKLGLGLRAVSFNRDVAELMGVNSSVMYTVSFLLGSAIAAITGILLAPITFVSYQLGFSVGFKGFAAAVVGGLGNFAGAMAGGIVFGLTEAIGAWFAPAYKDVIAFGVLVLVIVFRPHGLFGRAEVQKV